MSGLTPSDLDRMPGHVELIGGRLFPRAAQRAFHMITGEVLRAALGVSCPSHLRVRREMSVVLGPLDRLEPDVMLVEEHAVSDLEQTWYPADAVPLVVEVVSPESAHRDRKLKPRMYADAGIRHFWLVEENDGRAVVHTYELDPVESRYRISGIHRDRLSVTVPYPVDADLAAIAYL